MKQTPIASAASLDLYETLLDVALLENLITKQEAMQAKRSTTVIQRQGSMFSHISEVSLLEIVTLLSERWGGPEVGVALALKADVKKLGIMGELIALSETPSAAFYQVARFSRILHQSSSFELKRTSHRLSMVRNYLDVDIRYRQAALVGMYWALAHVALIPQRIFNCNVSPCTARFEGDKPDDMILMKSVFGDSLYFNQEEISVSFELASLKDIRQEHSSLLGVMESVAQTGLNDIMTLDSLTSQVRSYISQHMEGMLPSQDMFAKTMGISIRSLQRKLAREGTSFRIIFDEVYRRKAEKLLNEEQISISEISFRLGYAEQAAFTHAVQRWFGCSPRQVRQRSVKSYVRS